MSKALGALGEFEQTIVAIASSTEPSARGVVRLSGLDVAEILGRMAFAPNEKVIAANKHAAEKIEDKKVDHDDHNRLERSSYKDPFLDRLGLNQGQRGRPLRTNLFLDLENPIGPVPVSVLYWPTKRSYTGQPSAELHLVGSQPLLRGAVDCAMRGGARAARPGEFTLRAFLGGRLDLTQAEAVLGVIDAEGRGSLNQALEQLSGNLSRPLESMRDEVLNLLADVEAGLDFVDEDIEFISDEQLVQRLNVIMQQIDQAWNTMQSRGGGSSEPVVTLRGEPNAGKSFLLNRLTESKAAIVADVAGTTRDVVYATARIGHRQVRLADTAGIEPGRSEVERMSQTQAEQASRRATLRIWCVDSSRDDFGTATERLRAIAASEAKSYVTDLWVATKIDQRQMNDQELYSQMQVGLTRESADGCTHICSALTGEGMPGLVDKIIAILDSMDREEVGSVLGTAARCRQTLDRAKESAKQAIRLTEQQDGHEFVAAEIRTIAQSIGEVTGAVYTDDLLDRVFSRFCIGK